MGLFNQSRFSKLESVTKKTLTDCKINQLANKHLTLLGRNILNPRYVLVDIFTGKAAVTALCTRWMVG
jgi:hypothetical protein